MNTKLSTLFLASLFGFASLHSASSEGGSAAQDALATAAITYIEGLRLQHEAPKAGDLADDYMKNSIAQIDIRIAEAESKGDGATREKLIAAKSVALAFEDYYLQAGDLARSFEQYKDAEEEKKRAQEALAAAGEGDERAQARQRLAAAESVYSAQQQTLVETRRKKAELLEKISRFTGESE